MRDLLEGIAKPVRRRWRQGIPYFSRRSSESNEDGEGLLAFGEHPRLIIAGVPPSCDGADDEDECDVDPRAALDPAFGYRDECLRGLRRDGVVDIEFRIESAISAVEGL